MSKLVIVTSTVQALLGDAAADFACTPTDALHFGHRLGEVVLIATVTSTGAHYEAVGTLAGFQNDAAGRTRVHLEQINSLLSPVPVFAELPSRQAIFEIDNEIFEGVIAQGTGDAQFDEETTRFRGFSSRDILDQLARQSRRRCVFSDVITYKGVATIIRPLSEGGSAHVSNFLFLDREPSELFTRQCWTVGPSFGIILDTQSAGPDLMQTVNAQGVLALGERSETWPDRSALAWHRQQFFHRNR